MRKCFFPIRLLYVHFLCRLGLAIDISSSMAYPAGALSNFTHFEFSFRGFHVASMEGLLQGLKFSDAKKQADIFQLIGVKAKRKGAKSKWKDTQTIYWQGVAMARESDEYKALLREAYDALATNAEFRAALLATGRKRLFHTMGKTDPKKTVLTEKEFCKLLTDVRSRLWSSDL